MQDKHFRLMSIAVSKHGDGYLGYSSDDREDRRVIDAHEVEIALSDLGFDISNEYEVYKDSYLKYYLQGGHDELLAGDEEYEWVSVELQFAKKVSN